MTDLLYNRIEILNDESDESLLPRPVGECHSTYGTDSIDVNVTFKPDHTVGCLGLQLYMDTASH